MKKLILDEHTPAELKKWIEDGCVVIINPKGTSMLPFIREGKDKVILSKPDLLKTGDIVLVSLNGRYLMHRIYAIDDDNLTLMGDGHLTGNEYCKKSDVIGLVTEIIDSKGRHRKPGTAWLWRHTLWLRKYQLKAYRKYLKLSTR